MSHLQEVRLEELNPVLDVRQQEKSQKKTMLQLYELIE